MGLDVNGSSLASKHVSRWRIVHRIGGLAALVVSACLSNGSSLAAGPGDLDFVTGASLPPALAEALAKFPQTANFALSARINPFYLQGDFNGDGSSDTAVLVVEKATGKQGIAFLLGQGIEVVGAGKGIGNGGDDLSWMDAWYVFVKGEVEQGAFEEAPPTLKGDALMVIKTEAASGLIYWNGSRFAWYQQGD